MILLKPLKEVYKINEDTWNFNYTFSEDNLLQKINELSSIGNLASEMNVETNIIINWLNKPFNSNRIIFLRRLRNIRFC